MKFTRCICLLLPLAAVLASAGETTVVDLAAVNGLRYNFKTIYVKPGAEVTLNFSNNDTMLHNLVITRPGARMEVVNAAIALGTRGTDADFIPAIPAVLWAFKILPQGETATLKFKAPMVEAAYPYVCTYPGHGFIMFGDMIVTPKPLAPVPSPDLLASEPAPVPGTNDPLTAHIRRGFMPDVGPASMAVMLPGQQSYCWDAGACRFRYAWSGGGITSVIPHTNPKGPETLIGTVYYTETVDFPIRVGENSEDRPTTIFMGYRLDPKGQPEFEYQVDGVPVREFIDFQDGKLRRRFRTAGQTSVWFRFAPDATPQLSCTGKREGNAFHFAPEASREFTITINPGGGK